MFYSILTLFFIIIFSVNSFATDYRALKKEFEQMKKEKRIALIIGNSKYKSSPLKNPENDAKAMANALKKLNFEVMLYTNVNQTLMKKAIDKFGKKIRNNSGVGLFYYAGHGMQVRGINYLIPINANIDVEDDVEYESIDLGRVLGKMNAANNRLNVVILDACRNNPFARSFRSEMKGLAQVRAPEGTYIAYATAPGSVAADGNGKNGLFTEKLIKHMGEGLEIAKLFRKVRNDVKKATNGKQIPWTSSSITGDFYFQLPETLADIGLKSNNTNSDAIFWEAISSSKNTALYDAYLKKFPNGKYRIIAKEKIKELNNKTKDKQKSEYKSRNYIDNLTGMEFVFVKGGCYQMGDIFGDGDSDQKPVHEVCIDDFYIGKYEVTQNEWKKIMGSNPSWFNSCGGNCPVEQVTWIDVKKYIKKLNNKTGKTFRLPTEAEWEYAARSGGKDEKYSGGNNVDSVAWYRNNSNKKTHPVGQKSPNGLGIYDMSGNVEEWCEDVYRPDAYNSHRHNNPKFKSNIFSRVMHGEADFHVLRGGSYSNKSIAARTVTRSDTTGDTAWDSIGFRLVISTK